VNSDTAAHILITRMNLTKPDPDWFRRRLEPFRKFCVPSVRAQVYQPTCWLLLFDKDTPPDFCDEVMQGVDGVKLLAESRGGVQEIKAWIRANISTPWVITTRLDSDDARHPQYLSDMQQGSRPKVELLDLPSGWALYMGRVFNWRWTSNFVSLVERNNAEMLTVNDGPHNTLKKRFPYRVVNEKRRWLYVLHGNNILGENKIRDFAHKSAEVSTQIIDREFRGITLGTGESSQLTKPKLSSVKRVDSTKTHDATKRKTYERDVKRKVSPELFAKISEAKRNRSRIKAILEHTRRDNRPASRT